jgi:hypothetical protein
MELEHNFDKRRNYKDNKSLSASNRRCYMGYWLHLAWGGLRMRNIFLEGSFTTTVLIRKDGTHSLKLDRLDRKYSPV